MSAPGKIQTNPVPAPPKGGLTFGIIIHALTGEPEKLRVLIACTLAVMATVFEPTYLTLST